LFKVHPIRTLLFLL